MLICLVPSIETYIMASCKWRNRKCIGYTLAPLERDHQSFFNSLKLLVVYKYIGHWISRLRMSRTRCSSLIECTGNTMAKNPVRNHW